MPFSIIYFLIDFYQHHLTKSHKKPDPIRDPASFSAFKFQIIKALIIAGLLLPRAVVLFGLAKWPLIFSCFLLPILWSKLKQFFEHPDKQTTYLQMIKYLSIFFITYIAIYTVLVLI